MQHLNEIAVKSTVGVTSAVAAVTTKPSEYVSIFEKVYDFKMFVLSGDDIARATGVIVGVIVAFNIFWNIAKDVRDNLRDRRNRIK